MKLFYPGSMLGSLFSGGCIDVDLVFDCSGSLNMSASRPKTRHEDSTDPTPRLQDPQHLLQPESSRVPITGHRPARSHAKRFVSNNLSHKQTLS